MDSALPMHGSYNYGLVTLSVVLSLFAAYAALDLSGRVASARGLVRWVWLGAGGAAMGVGIWAMHYLAMLALTMPIAISYNLPTVALSLFAAMAASAVALFVVGQPKTTLLQEITGSVVMGGGIAAMHYIGMAAMRCSASTQYNRKIVALSVVLAIATSFAALKLTLRVRDEKRTTRRKVISALVLGAAIPLTHYTGMWAASFHFSGIAPNLSYSVGISTIGIAAISASTFFILFAAIASAIFDRFREGYRDDLVIARERELYFQTMAEAVPEIIWTATPDGADDYFNQNCFDYTGMTHEQLRGSGWKAIVHPDDVDVCTAKWQNALRSGEPYSVEYRLLGKDQNYCWFLCRANPVKNAAGEIIKWFGTCTDIEDQKQNQQSLEDQIRERTEQLAETNTRLQEEMIEKDFARSELDQQNDRMMVELKQRSDRATLLAKMGELLQSCLNREEVFAAALGYAPRIFPAAPGAIALLNSSRTLVEVIGSWVDCHLPLAEFDPADCWALRTGHTHLVLRGDSTARCAHAVGVEHTYLCIPILAQGETLGVLHLQATDAAPTLDVAEISFKTTFAGQVGLSIANIKLREALRTQSVRDALTGLYNRRYLEEMLDREVRRAGRGGQSLGVLMIDLDYFKKFNDTYGHDAGDAILRETGTYLAMGVRAEDFVCRYGGEEFVVVLPTADAVSSRARAERLCTRMRELTVMHQGRSLGIVTISVGVASFPENGMSPKELMASADAALYQAKRGGRNQVICAEPKPIEQISVNGKEKATVTWS